MDVRPGKSPVADEPFLLVQPAEKGLLLHVRDELVECIIGQFQHGRLPQLDGLPETSLHPCGRYVIHLVTGWV